MGVTIATVIRNVCLSRHRKADSICFRSCIQTLTSLTHLVAQKPDRTTAIQSVHNVSRTKEGFQNAITTELYIEMSRMSNQLKAEFVGDIFCM
jgi:carboxypeptidase C (cathepsin A)